MEAISRDMGSPNLFVTINVDPRASPDVRQLIYYLEHGTEMDREEPFVKDPAEFTRLLSKFAPFVAIYLYRKVKIMFATNRNGKYFKESGAKRRNNNADTADAPTRETPSSSWPSLL